MQDDNISIPVAWVRERDLDLLLAESLCTRRDFVEWVLAKVPSMHSNDQIAGHVAQVNFNRPDALPDGTGETDVLVEVRWDNGDKGLLSIENKVAAPPQEGQADRHVAYVTGRAQQQRYRFAAAVLVAPRQWIDGHLAEADVYGASISLEAIAGWHKEHDDPAVNWRGGVFDQAAKQRTVFAPAPELDEWCRDFADVIADVGLALEPQSRRQTDAPGQGKADRFIWCASDTLEGDMWAMLVFKHRTANHPGRVAIEAKLDSDHPLHARLEIEAPGAGYVLRATKAYQHVEALPSAAPDFNMTISVAEQVDDIAALAKQAAGLRDWWNSLVTG